MTPYESYIPVLLYRPLFSIALVYRASRKIDAHKIIEYQGLRRLCELYAVIWKRVLRRVENLAELLPVHRAHPLRQLSI